MRRALQLVLSVFATAGIIGCNGGSGSGTVNYNPANPDGTPADVNLLIKVAGQQDLQVGKQTPGAAKVSFNYGSPVPNTRSTFSVLATATDAESGIRYIKLSVTRTVCYRTSSGGLSQAYTGTVMRKEQTYTDQTRAPVQASLGDTGIFDPGTPATASIDNLLVFTDANGTRRLGVGVSTRWNMEARNFGGGTTYSDGITVFAGDVSCVTNP
ncbi:MAG TPA: hypothetical protein VGC44_14620 [Longimicrobiales bacterium]